MKTNNETQAILESMLAEIKKNNQMIRGLQQTIQDNNAKTSNALDDLQVEYYERAVKENRRVDDIEKWKTRMGALFVWVFAILMILAALIEMFGVK